MSTTQAVRTDAAPGTRCLLLQLEPTPYIVPRANYIHRDPSLRTELFYTYVNSSQPWGRDADIGRTPVLLDPMQSSVRRVGNVFRLLRSILIGRYTVAHLAGWGHWVVRLAILCCRLARVPFSVESDSPLLNDLSGIRQHLKRWIYPFWMRWISFAIPGGTRQANFFRYYGVPEEKICVSHMTIDTEALCEMKTPTREELRKHLGVPRDMVLFLFVGRLLELKGLDTLFRAFECAILQNSRLGLLIAGDGPERPRVEKAAAEFPGRLFFVGRQDRVGVVGLYRASDAFVLTSRDENWGLVVNEAMTCGLPVLVSDGCGCSDDLVSPGRNGFVFPTDDWQRLAEAMLTLAGSETARREMGKHSEEIIRPWTIQRQAETIRAALVRMSYAR